MVTVTIRTEYTFDPSTLTLEPGHFQATVRLVLLSGETIAIQSLDGEGCASIAEDEARLFIQQEVLNAPRQSKRRTPTRAVAG